MSRTRPTVREVLARVGVPEEAFLGDRDDAPWFVRALVGFGAWVASFCFVMFLALSDLLRGGATLAVFGVGLTFAAAALRFRTRGAFPVQLALAASLTGQAMFVAGVGKERQSDATVALAAALLEIVLVIVNIDRVHRFLSSALAVAAIAAYVHFVAIRSGWDLLGALLLALVWALLWFEPEIAAARGGSAHGPVLSGLATGLLGLLLALSIARAAAKSTFLVDGVATVAVAALLLVVTLTRVARTPASARVVLAATAVLVVGWLSRSAPGLLVAPLVFVLGFHRRHPGMMTLAALFFAAFLGFFYYELAMTLLAKAGVLAASGAVAFLALLLVPREAAP